MNCLVCGKEFGFWAKHVSDDAADLVCNDCEQAGEQALTGAADASLNAGTYDEKTARAALERFDALAAKYHVRGARLQQPWSQFVAKLFHWLDGAEEPGDDVIIWLSKLTKERKVELGEGELACFERTRRRRVIGRWRGGRPPEQKCDGLLLGEGEVCHWEEPARLYEQRTRRQYVGGYGGVSVRLARGVRLNTGAFKGTAIDMTYLADLGLGTLHLTSQRIAFTGGQAAVAIPHKKLLSVEGFEDGFQVFRTNAKKPTLFGVCYPELTVQLLALATPSPND